MYRPMLAYLWVDGLRIKDLTLETIRQALIGADEVNLHMLGPLCRLPLRYDDPTAADDKNKDKASISDASDLSWELSRCTNNAAESLHRNCQSTSERRASRKGPSPRKRIKEETLIEEHSEEEENKESNQGKSSFSGDIDELPEKKRERGTLFELQELFTGTSPS